MSSVPKLPILFSFAYFKREKDQQSVLERAGEWELFVDSGAFTNFTSGKEVVSLAAYRDFLTSNQRAAWAAINLDVIGNPEASDRNFDLLKAAGCNVVPVFQRGASPREMLDYAAHAPFVCVGGISQNLTDPDEIAYLATVATFARQQGINIHGLGVGYRLALKHRLFSADSSTWIGTSRFGVLYLFDPVKGLVVVTNPTRKRLTTFSSSLGPLLESHGITLSQLYEGQAWNNVLQLATTRAWIRLSAHFRSIGLRYFMATGASNVGVLRDAWELERETWSRITRKV